MRLRIAALAALLLPLVALARPAAAQSGSALDGTYVYDAQASDNVNRAIEQAVAKMNFVTRPIARSRLRKTNSPYQRITISHTPERVTVVTDARAPIVSPANGSPIKWTREDGEKFDVSTTWAGTVLEQSFRAEDGQRVNHFSVSPDGRTLTMRVTITSPRLAAPLVYMLRYNRAS